MSDAAWQMLWSNLPGTLAALAAFATSIAGVIISIRNGRKVEEIHKATNGMQAQMMASAKKEGEAEGKAKEQSHPTTESVPK